MDYKTIDISKETLEHLYWNERLSIKAIADRLGLSVTPVYHSMERHNVRRRTELEIKRLQRDSLGISAEDLRDLYVNKQLPIVSIAYQLNMSSKTIRRLLDDYSIPARTRHEIQKISAPKRLRDKEGHGRNWQGGRIGANGYIKVWSPGHPRAEKHGNYVLEHIVIWENANNKRLPESWVVHHLNGIKPDNRPENLVAMPRSAHRDLAKPYKQRIRQLEARIAELEARLKNHDLFSLTPSPAS